MLNKQQIEVLNNVMYEMAIKGTRNAWELTASELAIINEAEKIGWILRISYTQIEWTELGVEQSTTAEDEQQTDKVQQAEVDYLFTVNEVWESGHKVEYPTEITSWSEMEAFANSILSEQEHVKSVCVKRGHSDNWTEYQRVTIKSLEDSIKNANPNHEAYIKQQQERIAVLRKRQARSLIDAPTAQQYDFICTAPEGEWRELLQIVFEGADPVIWERKRANYDINWQAKGSKKAQKRKKDRKAYAKNGGSVYPSKKHNNNGTFNMLPLARV